MMQRISILTRGSHSFGMGHMHRSLWLREALQGCGRKFEISVHCLPDPEAQDYYRGRSAEVHFADWLVSPESLPEADLRIVDWLDSPVGYIEQLRQSSSRIMLLDDHGPATGEADLVVRSLLSPIASGRGVIGRALVLSGIQYVQLAPAIMKLRYGAAASLYALETSLVEATEREPGPLRCIMLSFGGSPRPKPTEFVLKVLAELKFKGRVIVKPAIPEMSIPADLDVELHEDAGQFHELLSTCDACVIGGGLTLYEALFLGVPPLVMPVVEHQYQTARKLNAAGCCLIGSKAGELSHNQLAGRLLELLGSPIHRGRLIHNGMRLVDGRGIFRTLDALLELLDGKLEPGTDC